MSGMFMRFPKGRAKALTLSYDDGTEQDIRLIRIMNQNGLKGTFNLNSGRFAPEGTVYPPEEFHRKLSVRHVKEVTNDTPVLLLDDVLSELDRNRQNYLLDNINNIQTIITCTGLEEFIDGRLSLDKVFHISDGTVIPEK